MPKQNNKEVFDVVDFVFKEEAVNDDVRADSVHLFLFWVVVERKNCVNGFGAQRALFDRDFIVFGHETVKVHWVEAARDLSLCLIAFSKENFTLGVLGDYFHQIHQPIVLLALFMT